MSHSEPDLATLADRALSRRHMLCRIGGGFGALGLAACWRTPGS